MHHDIAAFECSAVFHSLALNFIKMLHDDLPYAYVDPAQLALGHEQTQLDHSDNHVLIPIKIDYVIYKL